MTPHSLQPGAELDAEVAKAKGANVSTEINQALLDSCRELKTALALAMQAMAKHPGAWSEFEKLVKKNGVRDRIGVRANEAIAAAEKSAQEIACQ